MKVQSVDAIAIRETAMDYAEGWFDGDAERMARCLHPNLAKRAIKRNPDTGEKIFNHLTKEDMIRYTKEGGGTAAPRDRLYYKVDILDVYEEIAVVRVETYPYIDYLQLAKESERWLIVNVLYTSNRAKRD
jgi:hypothetical protein